MEGQAMFERIMLWFRPSRVLGLLLFVELVVFVLFAGWELIWFRLTFSAIFHPPSIRRSGFFSLHWLPP